MAAPQDTNWWHEALTRPTGGNDQSLPIGVGVHRGVTYVGPVGSDETVSDITVMGDAVNTAARLSAVAKAWEILVSNDAFETSSERSDAYPERSLELKGKSRPVRVRVL